MGLPEAWGGPGLVGWEKVTREEGGPVGALPGWCVRGRVCGKRGPPSLHPDYLLVMAQHLPSSLFHSSTVRLFSGNLAHICTPTPASPPLLGVAALALPALLPFLSPVLSWLSLQLPADRVRQVHPVLRAPGPPSTSNQIPPTPRRPPLKSLPGQQFCDLTVAPPAPKRPIHHL